MSTTAELLKREARDHLEEGRRRIHRCLGMLNGTQVWHRPNTHTASVGNLVLHLGGNVRQWIISTLGGEMDVRQRDLEFNEPGPIPTATLLAQLDAIIDRALAVVGALTEQELQRTYRVQAYEPSGTGILVHVTEHFSYHVGQITLHTKLMLDVDTGYYAGVDLNAKGSGPHGTR